MSDTDAGDTKREEPEHGEWSEDETARWCWSCKQYLREDLWDYDHEYFHAPDSEYTGTEDADT